MKYKVVGPCEVDGVPPGGIVTREQLEAAGANIDALIGFHLEEIPSPAGKKAAARDDE